MTDPKGAPAMTRPPTKITQGAWDALTEYEKYTWKDHHRILFKGRWVGVRIVPNKTERPSRLGGPLETDEAS